MIICEFVPTDSIVALQVWNALQLVRLDMAIKDVTGEIVSPASTGAGSRPFATLEVSIPPAAITAEQLGWSEEHCNMFEAEQLSNGYNDPASGRVGNVVTFVDAPVQHALVRVHRVCIQKLEQAGQAALTARVSEASFWMKDAVLWQETWASMVSRLDANPL